MLKRFLKFSVIALSVIFLLATSSFAVNNDVALIAEKTSVDEFILEDNITLDTSSGGNVFAIGSNLTINNNIAGDLFVLADTLVINANTKIDGTLFALANTIKINGSVDAVYAMSDLFELTSSGNIKRELHLISDYTIINGNIDGNAYLNITNFSIKTGHIAGDFYYSSNTELTGLSSNVSGTIYYEQIVEETKNKSFSSYLQDFINILIFTALVWFILGRLTPNFLDKSSEAFNGFTKNILSVVGYGILALILIPVIVIMLILSGMLLNVSLSLLSLYIFFIALSGAIFRAILVTSVLNKNNFTKTSQKIASIVLVTLITYVLTLIPFIGFYAKLAYAIIALGCIFKNAKQLLFKSKDKA